MKKNNYGGLKTSAMPSKLSTLVSKISAIPNYENTKIIDEFYHYMKENGASEKHMTNELQTVLYYATFLGPNNCLLDMSQERYGMRLCWTPNVQIQPMTLDGMKLNGCSY